MRILLIQLRRLGDLILTTPAILALRDRFPKAHIALAVTADCESLVPAIPAVNKPFICKRGMRNVTLSRELRAGNFNCAIDFTQNDRSGWLAFVSGAPRRIASEQWRRKSKLRARFYNEFVPCAMKDMHTIDYNLALLQPLGISSASIEPMLDLPRSSQEAAAKIIEREIGNQPFAIFHPGSTRPEKFWKPDRWAEIIAFAKNQLGLQPLLSSGNSALERALIAEIHSHLSVPAIDLAGSVDLLTLAALIARARLLVTVDSAPTHLAAAMKTPQVVLFGPTNPFHWHPRTSPAVVLFGGSHSDDFQRRAPKHPMNQISTKRVIDAMRSVHTAPAASAV
jgi:predicted lipopolysaccharide heptosyltransferase III